MFSLCSNLICLPGSIHLCVLRGKYLCIECPSCPSSDGHDFAPPIQCLFHNTTSHSMLDNYAMAHLSDYQHLSHRWIRHKGSAFQICGPWWLLVYSHGAHCSQTIPTVLLLCILGAFGCDGLFLHYRLLWNISKNATQRSSG